MLPHRLRRRPTISLSMIVSRIATRSSIRTSWIAVRRGSGGSTPVRAVIRLDVPMVRPDQDPGTADPVPSYAAAVKASGGGRIVLPSVNMIDGKAKQFDDGLYAALDQAYYLGHGEAMKSHFEFLNASTTRPARITPAAPFWPPA